MKRIALFLMTNLAVVLVLSASLRILGVERIITEQGINFNALLVFSAVIGFGGAIISLLISKPMAKMSTGARIIDPSRPANSREAWLVDTVAQLSQRANIGMPEVAIYDGAPNAFATGAFRNNALVAVSTGLLDSMTEEEVAAVLGHEVAHVANGDMVTLTLIQGVVNTFVIFLARIVGYVVDTMILRNERGPGIGYFVTVIAAEIIFGVLATIIVAGFSRRREYRADAGSAQLLGSREPMIRALARLGNIEPGALPKSVQMAGISGKPSVSSLFASHPPIQARIITLQRAQPM
ncbi:MAG: protease HtpX [Pigmentiphaga sp.]